MAEPGDGWELFSSSTLTLTSPTPAQPKSTADITPPAHTFFISQDVGFPNPDRLPLSCTSPAAETFPLVPGETSSPLEGVKS